MGVRVRTVIVSADHGVTTSAIWVVGSGHGCSPSDTR